MKPFVHPPFKHALPGISFTLPSAWETTGFEYDRNNGRFAFSNRMEPMGQFSFRKVPAVPDMPRIWEEIHRRATEGNGAKLRFTTLKSGVLFVLSGKEERFYASIYHPEKHFLLEWIFAPSAWSAVKQIERMLERVTLNPSDHQGRENFALFGIEASIPEGFELQEITPYPANIELLFENKRHHKIVLHRYGIAACQLEGDTLANFYHRKLCEKRYAIKTVAGRDDTTFDVPHLEFRVRGRFGFDALLGGWWRGIGEAVFCSRENRIYAFEHIAPARIRPRECVEQILPAQCREAEQ